MIHTSKDGRKWAVIFSKNVDTSQLHVGQQIGVGPFSRFSWGCRNALSHNSRVQSIIGTGQPICPSCCRAAIASGLLDPMNHIPKISEATDTSWAAHLYAEGERDTMLDREHWGGFRRGK